MNIYIIGTARVLITIVCLYFVYKETGPVTTFLMALMAITNEFMAVWARGVNEVMKASLPLLKILIKDKSKNNLNES